jgi:hypothetical protein
VHGDVHPRGMAVHDRTRLTGRLPSDSATEARGMTREKLSLSAGALPGDGEKAKIECLKILFRERAS